MPKGFYNTDYWRTIRKVLLEKNGFFCSACGFVQTKHDRIRNNNNPVIHHTTPISKGGGEHPDNLKVYCNSCHTKEHMRIKRENKTV